MQYNFDTPVNRFGTNSVKYDEMPNSDTIALWVADMDFETAPVIRKALAKRLEHGCFGYTFVPESYYQSVIDWFGRRHHWQIDRSWFIYTSGVVPAISAIIKGVADHCKVLIQTPVYNCFFSSIRNNECLKAENRLIYHNGRYTIDWDDFEHQCQQDDVRVFLLCNPHNPAGRVWSADELKRMGDICKRNNVFVIADEIHCEFTNHCQYTPFASVSDAPCAVCISPSKAFNIAGLQIANIIIPDANTRAKVDRAININEVCDVNPFGVIALQAAYTAEGEEWLKQLNEYIYANYDYAKAYFAEHLPQMTVTQLEGTYLLWLDISSCDLTSDKVANILLDKANVCVNAGTMYGEAAGSNFIRINLATQRARLAAGLDRMAKVINELKAQGKSASQ